MTTGRVSLRLVAAVLSIAALAAASSVSESAISAGPVADVFSTSFIPNKIARGIQLVKRGASDFSINDSTSPIDDSDDLPFFAKWTLHLVVILATYEWPSWVLFTNFTVWMTGLFAGALISYAVGAVMTTAVMAQSDRPKKTVGLGQKIDLDDASAQTLLSDDETKAAGALDGDDADFAPNQQSVSAMVVSSTNIRAFFREAKRATGMSMFRTCLRGARWGVLYTSLFALVLGLADDATEPARPSPEGLDVRDLPFTLPATTFPSIVMTFIVALLATPLHTLWTFSILQLSPAPVSVWRTLGSLKTLPYRSLLVPAVVFATGFTLCRTIVYTSLTYLFRRVSTILAVDPNDSRVNLGKKLVNDDLAKIAWLTASILVFVTLAEVIIAIPAQMFLIRAEAAALVATSGNGYAPVPASLSNIEANDSISFAGLRTLVPVDACQSTGRLTVGSACSGPCSKSRCLAALKTRLPCHALRSSIVLYFKRLFLVGGIHVATIAFSAALFTLAYQLKL